MKTQNKGPFTSRATVIQSLSQFRQEWCNIAGQDNLINVNASVGLLLADVINLLNFSPEEREAALGSELCSQVEQFLSSSPIPE